MKPFISFVFLFSFFSFIIQKVNAQKESKPYNIAVFTPIYLDSIFDGDTYKLGNNNLPKISLSGLEFYNGVQLAIDSLRAEGVSINVHIYDYKSTQQSLNTILQIPEMSQMNLIIACFNNRNDIKPIANFAATNAIPLLSATYPNDGGVSNNPYFILLNSTLRTHCEALYKFIQRNYATGNLILVTHKGTTDNLIQSLFAEVSSNTPSIPLKWKSVELPDTFNNKQLAGYLDSTKNNIIICGTVNENFGLRLVKQLNTLKYYNAVTIGMPTWDALKMPEANAEERNTETIYSTPYNFSKIDNSYKYIDEKYRSLYGAKPNDIVLKGFEVMFHFTHLLIAFGNDNILKHLSDKQFKLFNDYDIRIVTNNTTPAKVDYLENKKIYFIKKVGNSVKAVY
jgi:hypothetical protein